MKHTGGTIRRTDDGFDPLEVAGDGKKFARPKIQEILVFLRWVKKSCTTSINLGLLMHNLYPRTPKLNVE